MGKAEPLVNGKSILQVMELAVPKGQNLILKFDGPDESEAAACAQKYLQENL